MRPRWADDHALLAAVARHIHAGRAAAYPRLVAAGRLDADVAAAGLRIADAIARDWNAIAALNQRPAGIDDADQGGAWKYERVAMLTDAGIRARTAADAAPRDPEVTGFADAVDTLLWWEGAQPSARWLADTTIALRAQAQHDRAANAPVPTTFTFGVAA